MKKKRILLLFIITFLSSILIGCQTSSVSLESKDTGGRDEKLNIVVSILPQADLVEMLGEDQVEVTVMIPPGASPDSYEPSTKQLKDLSKADIYLMIGHLPFETAWQDRLLSTNPDLLAVDCSHGIQIIDQDPHIWLSPKLAKKQLENICTALVKVDNKNKGFYLNNLTQAQVKLDIIDEQIKNILGQARQDTFLVYHPAWGYFARDYGLVEIAIEKDGKEPGPAEMAQIIAQAKKLGINTVFTSSQHSSRSAEAIAAELQARVVTLDPLPASYSDIIKSAELIGEALK